MVGALGAREVPRERALDTLLGYTVANDVTARDQQRHDGQWTRAKGYDSFCPLGPWIETVLDPTDLALRPSWTARSSRTPHLAAVCTTSPRWSRTSRT